MRQEVISKSCLILLLLFSAGLLAQAPPAAESKKPDYSQEASVIESLSRKVEFQNDGTGYTETTLRARIQSDAGVKQFGLLIFQYQQPTTRRKSPMSESASRTARQSSRRLRTFRIFPPT